MFLRNSWRVATRGHEARPLKPARLMPSQAGSGERAAA